MLEAARTISHDETAELYDGYLNDFYRSLKAWRTGNELAGRIECGRSLRFLGELLFALDGVRAPYPKEWAGKLGELEPLILEVARTGEPRLQQELCVHVRERAAQRGYSHVYDDWTGDIDRVLGFEFPDPISDATAGLLLPLRSEQRVLDVAFLVARDGVGPGLVERPHVAQPRLLQHAPRRDVHDHRERDDALDTVLGEALVDQRARAFGRVPLAPGRLVQPVAELDLVRRSVLRRA